MSERTLESEILVDFAVEAEEYLDAMDAGLAAWEKNPGDPTLPAVLSRPAHALWGAASFPGLSRINRLAQMFEAVLDALQSGRIEAGGEVAGCLRASAGALRRMVGNVASHGVEVDAEFEQIMERLDRIRTGNFPSSDQAPGHAPDSLPERPPYALTIIGEGHLSDFMEEASEIVEHLNNLLVGMEKDPSGAGDSVNDVFRLFHNLKGNAGIIGYKELNVLTHDAENLLNKIRREGMSCSRAVIDMLLAAVDLIEQLLHRIDVSAGLAHPLDVEPLLHRLREAATEGPAQAEEPPEDFSFFEEPAAALREDRPAGGGDAESQAQSSEGRGGGRGGAGGRTGGRGGGS